MVSNFKIKYLSLYWNVGSKKPSNYIYFQTTKCRRIIEMDEPKKGMVFGLIEDAEEYYYKFAGDKGFSSKKGIDKITK